MSVKTASGGYWQSNTVLLRTNLDGGDIPLHVWMNSANVVRQNKENSLKDNLIQSAREVQAVFSIAAWSRQRKIHRNGLKATSASVESNPDL